MASMKARGAPPPSAATSRAPSYQGLQRRPSRLVRIRTVTGPSPAGTSHITPTIVKSAPASSVTMAGGAVCTERVPASACGVAPAEPACAAARASAGEPPSDAAAATASRSATTSVRVFTVSVRNQAATASPLRGAAEAAPRSGEAVAAWLRTDTVKTRTLVVAERLAVAAAASEGGSPADARAAAQAGSAGATPQADAGTRSVHTAPPAMVTLDAGADFTMVGVMCDVPAGDGPVTVRIRTSLDGRRWSPWYEGALEVAAEGGGLEGSLVPGAPATAVQAGADSHGHRAVTGRHVAHHADHREVRARIERDHGGRSRVYGACARVRLRRGAGRARLRSRAGVSG